MNPIMIFKFISFTCLVATVSCANLSRDPRHVHPSASQVSGQASPVSSSAADAAAKLAAQQAKLHYVEIGPSLKGDYKFGYDTGNGPAGQSFREETRLDDGTVKGAYGYVDANGKQRIVKYTAGKNGFVVDNDAEAPGQGGSAPAQASPVREVPEPVRRPQPVELPSANAPLAQPAQPSFDEQPQFNIQRGQTPAQPTVEDRARAEREHAEGLRQHQLAQQAALAQQQRLAQQLHLQQQQILASQARQQPAPQQNSQQQFASPQHQPQHQFPQPQVHQQVDPQTGSFFSSSTDDNLNQLLSNQFRQLRQGNNFANQFQQPQQQGFTAPPQDAPAFQQAAPQFVAQSQPADFGQLRAARQASSQQLQQQSHQPVGPQSVLAALHQQQQQDAQMLANLRAQQAARLQEQARHSAQQLRVPQPEQPQFHAEPQPQAFAAQPAVHRAPQPQAQAQPQFASRQLQPAASANSAVSPQPEAFGPPVIDIRTLNYSIGQQTRV